MMLACFRRVLLVSLILVCSACQPVWYFPGWFVLGPESDRQRAERERFETVLARLDERGDLRIGMTPGQVQARWGAPLGETQSVTTDSTRKVWVYSVPDDGGFRPAAARCPCMELHFERDRLSEITRLP
jgi:hypothetical protein